MTKDSREGRSRKVQSGFVVKFFLIAMEILQPTRYGSMLQEGVTRNIVESVTNLFDEYFGAGKANLRLIPYLEGDYWTDLAEDVIKVICSIASAIIYFEHFSRKVFMNLIKSDNLDLISGYSAALVSFLFFNLKLKYTTESEQMNAFNRSSNSFRDGWLTR